MAEGAGAIYNNFKSAILKGEIDLVNDTLRMILVSSYTPDIDTDTQYSHVSGNEYASGSGYTAGGKALTGNSVTTDTANDKGVFDADDVSWSSLGPLSPATPSHAILYDDTTTNKLLIAYWEIGTTATNGGDYALRFNSAGVISIA